MICIVGINGRQGKRYKSICEYLNIPYIGYDCHATNDDEYKHVVKSNIESETIIMNSDKIIIATNTKSHLRLLERFAPFKKPMLCETPIVKSKEALKAFKELTKINDQIYMVNHLAYLKSCDKIKLCNYKTYYDYFKCYGEGLYWDSIQVIGLAKDGFNLDNSSPLFDCTINGVKYIKSDIDLLYKLMVQDFYGEMKNLWDIDDIVSVTNKVLNIIEGIKDV